MQGKKANFSLWSKKPILSFPKRNCAQHNVVVSDVARRRESTSNIYGAPTAASRRQTFASSSTNANHNALRPNGATNGAATSQNNL